MQELGQAYQQGIDIRDVLDCKDLAQRILPCQGRKPVQSSNLPEAALRIAVERWGRGQGLGI